MAALSVFPLAPLTPSQPVLAYSLTVSLAASLALLNSIIFLLFSFFFRADILSKVSPVNQVLVRKKGRGVQRVACGVSDMTRLYT